MSSGDLTEEVRANKLAQEISGGLLTRASDVFLNVHGRPEVGRGWEGVDCRCTIAVSLAATDQ
jgi:hypothetical protein